MTCACGHPFDLHFGPGYLGLPFIFNGANCIAGMRWQRRWIACECQEFVRAS